jgi:hypothetical protein
LRKNGTVRQCGDAVLAREGLFGVAGGQKHPEVWPLPPRHDCELSAIQSVRHHDIGKEDVDPPLSVDAARASSATIVL